MKSTSPWPNWLAAISLAVLGGAALYYFWQDQPQQAAPPVAARPPAAAVAPMPAASEPAIHHPLAAASEPAALPSNPRELDVYVSNALIELLGRRDVLTFLNTDNFVHRAVASVDNLSHEQAPSRLWPVAPMAGRFTAEQRADGIYLSATNAKRYAGFVNFVESIDAGRAAALYLRLYPLLQAMYEQLGYPHKYFNDRVVDVIDLLIETPEPREPPKLKLVDVKGPIPSARPWLCYEFDDPALEARPAGQKILLRMGTANERRIKAKLSEFREEIAPSARVKQ
jgi:hypothetical protein